MLEVEYVFADFASALFSEGQEFVGDFACFNSVVLAFKPFFSQRFDFVGAVGALGSFLHVVGETAAELFVCDEHTESEFGEVLEE